MAKRRQVNFVPGMKTFYTLVVASIALYGIYVIAEPYIPQSAQVLGAKTLLAREDGQRQAEFHITDNNGHENVEIKLPDSGRPDKQIFQKPVGNGSQEQTFHKEVPPPHGEGGESKDNVMFVKMRMGSEASEAGRPEPKRSASSEGEMRHFGAISHFPISINPETNEMTITTPAGTKVVTILPDQAVRNMLDKGIISKIGGHIATGSAGIEDGDSSESGAFVQSEVPQVLDENVELTEKDGNPVYKIKGQKHKKLFGFIPVEIDKTVTVSGDTGEVESTQIPLFDRFIDILSL